jgi:hypothetical protein
VPWAPVPASSQFIDETLAFWQPRATRTLTREDGREIFQNLVAFFSILDDWDRAEHQAEKDVTSRSEAE